MELYKKIMAILTIGLLSCNANVNKEADTITIDKDAISNIQLSELNSNAIGLEQYKGKTIFINFWATWCKPCIQEMPTIQEAIKELKDEDIVFLFASNESAEQIEAFKNKNSYDFHYVKADNLEALNIMALPTTYIFDASGNLVFSEMGYRKWDDKNNIDLLRNIIKVK